MYCEDKLQTEKNIWLGNRIKELMDIKEMSLRDLALNSNVSKSTLQRITDGSGAKFTTLMKIANGLGVHVNKLRDMAYDATEIEGLLNEGKLPHKALLMSQEYLENSILANERAYAHGLIGRSFTALNKFQDAKVHFEIAYDSAIESNDADCIKRACKHILYYFSLVKDFESMNKLLDKAGKQKAMYADDFSQGLYYQYKGLCAWNIGKRSDAREYYIKSLSFYKKINDFSMVGKIQKNIADIYYHMHQYKESEEMLIQSIENLSNDHIDFRVSAAKDLVRTFVALGESEKALDLLEKTFEMLAEFDGVNNEIFGKLLLMKADLKDDAKIAISALKITDLSKNLKANLYDVLFRCHLRGGDAEKSFMYHNLVLDNVVGVFTNWRKGEWF